MDWKWRVALLEMSGLGEGDGRVSNNHLKDDFVTVQTFHIVGIKGSIGCRENKNGSRRIRKY